MKRRNSDTLYLIFAFFVGLVAGAIVMKDALDPTICDLRLNTAVTQEDTLKTIVQYPSCNSNISNLEIDDNG